MLKNAIINTILVCPLERINDAVISHTKAIAMELIPLSEVLQQMEKRDRKGKLVPFSLQCVKFNRYTKEGGDILDIPKAIIYRQKHVKKPSLTDKSKIPNHFDNGTRNLVLIPSGEIRKIHIRLITMFNGKQVFY